MRGKCCKRSGKTTKLFNVILCAEVPSYRDNSSVARYRSGQQFRCDSSADSSIDRDRCESRAPRGIASDTHHGYVALRQSSQKRVDTRLITGREDEAVIVLLHIHFNHLDIPLPKPGICSEIKLHLCAKNRLGSGDYAFTQKVKETGNLLGEWDSIL